MDVLDKVILEWCYRSPKGYPDLNNDQDWDTLIQIIYELTEQVIQMRHPYEYLSAEAQTVADQLINELQVTQKDIKANTKKRIIVLTNDNRKEVFSKLEKMGFSYDISIKGSSIGGFKTLKEDVEILVKPKDLHEMGHGVENEKIFEEEIKKALQEKSPLKIQIHSEQGPTLEYENITGVDYIGGVGERKGWKGDVKLISDENEDIHISIKKAGTYRWESVVRRYRKTYETFMNKALANEIPNLELKQDLTNPALLRMLNPNTKKPYGRIVILDHPDLSSEEEIRGLAFGPDNAEIVQGTFTSSDFEIRGDTLHISAVRTIKELKDFLPGDFPVLEFERNASKAYNKDGIYGRGIIMRAVPRKRFDTTTERSNTLVVSYQELI